MNDEAKVTELKAFIRQQKWEQAEALANEMRRFDILNYLYQRYVWSKYNAKSFEDSVNDDLKAYYHFDVNDCFMFEVGKIYETLAGDLVKVYGRTNVIKHPGYETLLCNDNRHRYDRSTHSEDAGRVTGTDHEYTCPHNFKRHFA